MQHTSALCVIPPVELWPPIQTIRRAHDKAFARWMPHVNLIYPFLPEADFPQAVDRLRSALATAQDFPGSFQCQLATFGKFRQRFGDTVHLKPICEPESSMIRLQELCLTALFPTQNSDKKRTRESPFVPHLTVAQFPRNTSEQDIKRLQDGWNSLNFSVTHVHLISRGKDTPFSIVHSIPLNVGKKTSSPATAAAQSPAALTSVAASSDPETLPTASHSEDGSTTTESISLLVGGVEVKPLPRRERKRKGRTQTVQLEEEKQVVARSLEQSPLATIGTSEDKVHEERHQKEEEDEEQQNAAASGNRPSAMGNVLRARHANKGKARVTVEDLAGAARVVLAPTGSLEAFCKAVGAKLRIKVRRAFAAESGQELDAKNLSTLVQDGARVVVTKGEAYTPPAKPAANPAQAEQAAARSAADKTSKQQPPQGWDVDGSTLEGGGQVLRNCVAYSCLLARDLHVYNIRGGRPKPGLKNQHLAGIQLVAAMADAQLTGGAVNSTEIWFRPQPCGARAGGERSYRAECSTAGSTSLLLQVALPCCLFAPGPVNLLLRGGTNTTFSPPHEFVTDALLPVLRAQAQVEVEVSLAKRGWFPKGGGEVKVRTQPVRTLRPIVLVARGELTRVRGLCLLSGPNEPAAGAEAMTAASVRTLRQALGSRVPIEVKTCVERGQPGVQILLLAETDSGALLASSALASLPSKGQRAAESKAPLLSREANKAAQQLLQYIRSGACVDEHLADQLVIYMCLAAGTSCVRTSALTLHTQTALHMAAKLTGAKVEVVPYADWRRAGGATPVQDRPTTAARQAAPAAAGPTDQPDDTFVIVVEGIGLQNPYL